MNPFDLARHEELSPLLCLIGILVFVGHRMASDSVRRWSWRITSLAYMAFLIYAAVEQQPRNGDGLAMIAFRGLLFAGLVFGPTAMVLAVLFYCGGCLARVQQRYRWWRQRRRMERERVERAKEIEEQQAAAARQPPPVDNRSFLDDARHDVRLRYSTDPELHQHIPAEQFAELLRETLPDTLSPVRARARATDLIERFDAMTGSTSAAVFTSDQDVIDHYTQLMETYRQSGIYDSDELETLWVELRSDMHEHIRQRHQRR